METPSSGLLVVGSLMGCCIHTRTQKQNRFEKDKVAVDFSVARMLCIDVVGCTSGHTIADAIGQVKFGARLRKVSKMLSKKQPLY